MSAGRAKKIVPKFEDFKSSNQINSAFVCLRNSASNGLADTPTLLHNVYLLCEICLKKIAIQHNITINTSHHGINTYLYKLKDLNLNLGSYYNYLASKGRLRLVQTFNYSAIRYSSSLDINDYPTLDELVTLFSILFDWLVVVESQRQGKV